MSGLRRTEAAGFSLAEAITLEEAETLMADGQLQGRLLSPERLFAPYPALKLNEVQTRMFCNGVRLDLKRIYGANKLDCGTPWRIFGADGAFLGLGQGFPETQELRLVKFFMDR